jgi:signal transduction histidine kinase
VWDVGLFVALAAAASCLLIRLRRSGAAERRQIRWVVLAGVFLVVSLAVQAAPIPSVVSQILPGVTAVVVAVAFAVAMLRHGLWDVEVIVRRSLVYGVLWASIAGIYVLVATGLGVAATSRLPIWIAIMVTVATTVVFEPARRRLEALANRIVFGAKRDPIGVIGELSERMATADHVGDTATHLAEASGIACDLAWVEVTVSGNTPVTRGTANGEPIVEVPIGDSSMPVGRLRCQPRAGFQLDADTRTVLSVLAAQTALGITQARLTTRLARASAEERRRVERDLHDGAQQELIALIARLGLARATANGDADVFEELQHDVQRILADLRSLAQGIHPSVLTDGGLGEAVRECADRLPLPIGIDIDPKLGASRPDPDIEAAAYFLVAETLTNTVKHAHAHRAAVQVRCLGELIRIEITDDGDGFEPDLVHRRGLAGIEDRIHAHGGTLQLTTGPSAGTSVIATIPSRASTR